jgi:hypothetical protein
MRTTVARLLALVAAVTLAACGSTAQVGDGGQPQSASGGLGPVSNGPDGSSTVGTVAAGTSSGGSTAAAGGATASGGSSGSAGGGGRPGGPGSASAVSGGGGAGGVGPGVTDSTIAIGLPYCNDCAAANAALGAGGEDPGDTRRYMQAAIDDVNARGGVLGRELVPVFFEISAADDIASSQQQACEAFTSDEKVQMIFFRGEIVYECALDAGIVVGGGDATGPVFEKYPNLFAPASIRLERLFQVTVRSMVKARWHETQPAWPTGRIGLLTWDTPDYRYAMENGYLAGLSEAGLEATDVRYIAVPAAAGSIAEASAAISNAVLSFRSQGIDHVFIGDGQAGIFAGAGLTFLFLSNAQSQGYFPRYGFNSNNSPDFDSHPKEQLVGMLAIDSFDTEAKKDEGIELNPVRERCFEVMRAAGLPVGQAQTQAVAIGACEQAWFAEAIVSRAGDDTTLPGMIRAGESLGTAYRSPYSYGNRLGPGQHDGVALFRALAWDEGCSCNKYTSAPFEP